jgi:trk system potassium uptake protein TrkH
MNIGLLSRSLGILLLLLAAGMLVCFGVGALLPAAGEEHNKAIAAKGWWISVGLTLFAGGALSWAGKGAGHERILRRDAIGIVGLAWFVCSLFAALPYLFCEPSLSIAQALFEGVSGLTTTGATVVEDLRRLPKTLLFWRSLTQWLGGMGILAMFVLVLSSLGSSGLTLFRSETSAHGQDLSGTTMRHMAQWLWLLYVALTVVCGLGMWALGMNLFQAINHAMTTVATAGFGTENTSFAGASFGVALKLWTTLFMFLSGISLPLYITMIRKRSLSPVRQHEETWIFVGVLFVILAGVIASLVQANGFERDPVGVGVDVLFNVVSILTTTGYASSDFDLWPPLAKGLLLAAMVVGGCAGSTAGGLKVSRILLWIRLLRLEIRRVYRPNEVILVKINGNQVPSSARGQTFVILTTAMALTALSSGLLSVLEPELSVVGCVSGVLACLMNIGPAFAELGPLQNFSGLSTASHLVLPVLMIVGRLEYLAVLALFSRNLWRRY